MVTQSQATLVIIVMSLNVNVVGIFKTVYMYIYIFLRYFTYYIKYDFFHLRTILVYGHIFLLQTGVSYVI